MILGSSDITQTAAASEAARSATDKAKLEEDLNKFLNLLVTQLKNQDPLDPMDANEFTSQLVQFASVEQQIYQNSNLEKMVEIQKASQVSNLVNYLDTIIEASGQTLNYEGSNLKFSYQAEDIPAVNTITIQNDKDEIVQTIKGELDADRNVYIWDGKDADGNAVPLGIYKVTVAAQDADENDINVKQTVYGRVTSAGAKDGVITLFMGDVESPLDKVVSVEEKPAP